MNWNRSIIVPFNSIIVDMTYKAKTSESELLEMLPHKWKIKHPEAIITKEEQ